MIQHANAVTAGKPFGQIYPITRPRSRARVIITRCSRIFAEEIGRAEAADDRTFQSMILLAGSYRMLGMTQKELAAELFITPMTLQRWGKGEKLPLVVARRAVFARLAELATTIIAAPQIDCENAEQCSVIPFPLHRAGLDGAQI